MDVSCTMRCNWVTVCSHWAVVRPIIRRVITWIRMGSAADLFGPIPHACRDIQLAEMPHQLFYLPRNSVQLTYNLPTHNTPGLGHPTRTWCLLQGVWKTLGYVRMLGICQANGWAYCPHGDPKCPIFLAFRGYVAMRVLPTSINQCAFCCTSHTCTFKGTLANPHLWPMGICSSSCMGRISCNQHGNHTR